MDLNSFIDGPKETANYKITFMLGKEKIKRFVSGSSKKNAEHLLEQDLKKEHPEKKTKILEVKIIENKKQEENEVSQVQ